jgi:hypothetical protein
MSTREFRDDDEGYVPWIAANPEGRPVPTHRGCARRGRPTDTDQLAPRRPVRHERFNSARAHELHYAHSTVKELHCR